MMCTTRGNTLCTIFALQHFTRNEVLISVKDVEYGAGPHTSRALITYG
jgi:hypothetical protein